MPKRAVLKKIPVALTDNHIQRLKLISSVTGRGPEAIIRTLIDCLPSTMQELKDRKFPFNE